VGNGLPDNFLEKINKRFPMGRTTFSDEYKGTLLWMLSDSSSYLNGAIDYVDGRRTEWQFFYLIRISRYSSEN
jgi:hypothetical protein